MTAQLYLDKLALALSELSSENRELVIAYYRDLISQQELDEASEDRLIQQFGEPSIIAASLLKKVKTSSTKSNYEQQGWQPFEHDETVDESKTKKNKNQSSTWQAGASADEHYPKRYSGFQRFMQIFGLLFINLTMMIWLFFAVAMAIFAGWICTAAFLASPIIIIGAYFTPYLTYPLLSLSIGLVMFGLGIFGLYICKTLTKYFFKVLSYYFKANLQVLRGAY
ncbi:DUF1700 domain-containing protein [Vagococcus zengguangii]|uniref:DUF1700 domain-containing protein n=1 Tax=Vagococcus zengguangii TaxID=2571750 RepID=UPI00110860E1|nr:DUF1700 domain-containing protein [Vagococcus zengguangii]TLG79504.1 DUF1700 domain-containing protein [Vagococcus zengguangii]